jgi:hypothetical protein
LFFKVNINKKRRGQIKCETRRLLLGGQGPVCRHDARTQSALIHSFVSTHRPENSCWICGPRVNFKAIKDQAGSGKAAGNQSEEQKWVGRAFGK